MVTAQEDKHELIHDHFLQHIGTHIPRRCSLNYAALGWEPKQLEHLEAPFTKEEVKATIFQMPKEKAPGPDGYIGSFFASCWGIVHLAFGHFYKLNSQNLHFLNQAYVVLIPKKENPMSQRLQTNKPYS